MNLFLGPLALVLALVAKALFRDHAPAARRPSGTSLGAFVLTLGLAALLAARFGPAVDRTALLGGLTLGGVATLAAELLGGWVSALALGVSAAACCHAIGVSTSLPAQLAAVVGAGLATISLRSEAGLGVALVAAAVGATDALGRLHSDAPSATSAGSLVGVVIVVGACLAWAAPKLPGWVRAFVVAGVAVLGGYFATRSLGEPVLLACVGFGAGAAFVLHLIFGEESASTVRVGLAAVISIGLATVAFGLSRGFGMGLALLAAAGVLAALNDRQALLTLGPLASITLYRLLREAQPDSTRALDIGQHYALLGLALGLVLPLIVGDAPRPLGLKGLVADLLWGALALAMSPLVVLMLGPKGAIGFVAGAGFAAYVQALRSRRDLLPLPLGLALAAATIHELGWLKDLADMTRDEKIRLFAYVSGGLAVTVVALAFVSRVREERA